MFRFGCDPNPNGPREVWRDQFVCFGAFAALSPNMPPLSAALRSPQVLLGMLFNAYLLVFYWAGRVTITDIAVFYLFEVGVYGALYVPRIFFHIIGDAKKNWRAKKENLEALFYWCFFGLFLPVMLVQAYTVSMTGYREQLAVALSKLQMGLPVFALQFCLGAFQFLTRPGHKYAYEAAVFPFSWYVAGQASIISFLFFFAVPGWLLIDSFVPGVTAFLLMRLVNEAGPQLGALKFDEDVSWNMAWAARLAARKERGRTPGPGAL